MLLAPLNEFLRFVVFLRIKYPKASCSYLTCSIQNKTTMYDVLVSSGIDDKSVNVTIPDKKLAKAVAVTAGDMMKYNYLIRKFQAQDQALLVSFFQDMNNRLLSGLWNRRNRIAAVAPSELPNFGLHGTDFPFLTELLDVLALDIEVERSWCSCCS